MIKLDRISYEINDEDIISDITFSTSDGDRIALVGPNGSGKTTLLKNMAGILKPTGGVVIGQNTGTVSYFPQELPAELQDQTVMAYLSSAGVALDYNVEKILLEVGLSADILARHIDSLSGGQRSRVLLASTILTNADTVLLDEPTNNLDIDGIKILEKYISISKKTFVIVSHDRVFLQNVTNKIVSIDKRQPGARVYNLKFDEYQEQRARELAEAAQLYQKSLGEKKSLSATAKDKWREGQEAENNKNNNDNDKTSFNKRKNRAAKKITVAAKVLKHKLERFDTLEKPAKSLNLNVMFAENNLHLSQNVSRLEDAYLGYGPDTKMGPINLQISRGDRVVITGSNGVGKTTLLKSLLNPALILGGIVNVGPSVSFGLIDQNHTLPNENLSIFENYKEIVGNHSIDTKADGNLKRHFYSIGVKSTENRPGHVSPGERSKVLLMALANTGCNVLLFDEPTNHLDLDSIWELEQALAEYDGTYIIVSHDRRFISNIGANHIIPFEDICRASI